MAFKIGTSSKELEQLFNQYGLNFGYTAEELESAIFKKQQENPNDENIELIHKELIDKKYSKTERTSLFQDGIMDSQYFEK